MANDWDIKPCNEACEACETSFQDKQSYWTRLMPGEEGYERKDSCQGCWDSVDDAEKAGISTWKGIFHAPPPPPEEALRKETAESLLRRLMESEDDANRHAIYVLGVMLERKKILVERDIQTSEEGMRSIVFEHRKSGEMFVVPDPGLHLSELASVQEEIVVLLGGKPRTPEVTDAGPEEDNSQEDREDREEDEPVESNQ